MTGMICLNNLKLGLSLAQLKADNFEQVQYWDNKRIEAIEKLNNIENALQKSINEETEMK